MKTLTTFVQIMIGNKNVIEDTKAVFTMRNPKLRSDDLTNYH